MGKYKVSVSNNNKLKDAAVKELNSLLFILGKGKYSKSFDADSVRVVVDSLASDVERLDNAIGDGTENVEHISGVVNARIKELASVAKQDYYNRFESAADELSFSLNKWGAVMNGDVADDEEEESAQEKASWNRKRLNARLSELADIKGQFAKHSERLEKDILQLEKDAAELDAAMESEDNERKVNELFRKISALKAKLDALNVRRSSYSACFNTLDIIFANATEIVNASDFASEEIGKAKALLNIDKLKIVLSEPEKAMAILKRMKEDINNVASKTSSLDNGVFNINTGGSDVSNDALQYKEALMRKKQEKAFNQKAGELAGLTRPQEVSTNAQAVDNRKKEEII